MEEFIRRGDALYERVVQPRLAADDAGKMVLIDIETGDHEIDTDEIAASERPGVDETGRFNPRSSDRSSKTHGVMITGRVNDNREAVVELVARGPTK